MNPVKMIIYAAMFGPGFSTKQWTRIPWCIGFLVGATAPMVMSVMGLSITSITRSAILALLVASIYLAFTRLNVEVTRLKFICLSFLLMFFGLFFGVVLGNIIVVSWSLLQ